MEIHSRRFKTIGYLGVSGGVSDADIPHLKAWLEAAISLKLVFLVDLNRAVPEQNAVRNLVHTLETAKEQGLKFIVINKDEKWAAPRSIMEACSHISSAESRPAEAALALDDRVRALKIEKIETDEKLLKILQSYGKDMKAIDDMQPDDFLRLNRKMADRQEHLLAIYTECVLVLKNMDEALSRKETAEEGMKTVKGMKEKVLGFLQNKGVG